MKNNKKDKNMEKKTFIDELTEESTGNFICRATRVWDGINPNTNTCIGLNVIFVDEKGKQVHARTNKDNYDFFKPKIKEGHIYNISNLEVVPSINYRPVDCGKMLTLDGRTEISEYLSNDVTIARRGFQFLEFNKLKNRLDNTILLTDIIGMLCGASEMIAGKQNLTHRC